MKTKPLVKEFIRFGVVGVLATALHYGIYYFLQSFINVNVAYTTGYVISFIVNFYLTSYFTFGTTPSWKKLVGMVDVTHRGFLRLCVFPFGSVYITLNA